jgi:ankyrin repeat protein
LIDNKADLNPQDNGNSVFISEFYTPLHYAAECGFVDMVKLLLNAGADQKIRNCQGRFAKDCSQNINIFTLFRDSDQ